MSEELINLLDKSSHKRISIQGVVSGINGFSMVHSTSGKSHGEYNIAIKDTKVIVDNKLINVTEKIKLNMCNTFKLLKIGDLVEMDIGIKKENNHVVFSRPTKLIVKEHLNDIVVQSFMRWEKYDNKINEMIELGYEIYDKSDMFGRVDIVYKYKII